jgi:60 kDa SS-A/Ro ribonucleoprotein
MHILRKLYRGRAAGTSQLAPQPGRDQIANSAGGYVYAVDDWARVERFLILGSEGGTYYASERALTLDNAQHLARMVREHGSTVVERTIALSTAGRAPKVSPAIFALAMCAGFGDDATRRLALGRGLQSVCRTGSHLLEFASYIEQFRGWGRGLRSGIRDWYENKPVGELAYQFVKYQSRFGFTHRDLMRLAHPVALDEARRALYAWVVRGTRPGDVPELGIVNAFESAKATAESDLNACVTLVRESGLPREAIPTAWLREPAVWAELLVTMPMTATIRNLATMTRVGLLTPKSPETRLVIERLRDRERLRRARVHPIALLAALETYGSGRSARGDAIWKPVDAIVEALDEAFYLAFDLLEPTGARTLVALDVSASMASGAIAAIPGLTPRVAAAALAMTHLRSDERVCVMAFSDRFVELPLRRDERLSAVMKRTAGLPFQATDCALPMLYALEQRLAVDAFVIYTDNETWAGAIHPGEALRRYRERTGIPAKLVTAGLTSTGFSIADPNDAGMLDVVGFDMSAPAVIAGFAKTERNVP